MQPMSFHHLSPPIAVAPPPGAPALG